MRLRSRAAETEDVNQRRLQRGSVSTTAIQGRAVRQGQQWPGQPRPVAPKDLSEETVTELDGRFIAGRFLRVSIPAQTWDGPLDLGDVVVQERWPDVETLPAGGYYTVFAELDPSEGVRRDVAWELRVDGSAVQSGTSWTVEGVPLSGTLPTNPADSGDPWELVNTGDPVSLDGGEVTVHLVEPVQAEPPPAPIEAPESVSSSGDGGRGHTTSSSRDFPVPSSAEPGDLLIAVANVGATTDFSLTPVQIEDDLSDEAFELVSTQHGPVGYVGGAIWTKRAVEGDAGKTLTFYSSGGSDGSWRRLSARCFAVPVNWSDVIAGPEHTWVLNDADPATARTVDAGPEGLQLLVQAYPASGTSVTRLQLAAEDYLVVSGGTNSQSSGYGMLHVLPDMSQVSGMQEEPGSDVCGLFVWRLAVL